MKFEVSGPKTHQIEDLDHYSGCQDMAHVKKRVPGPWNPQKIQKNQGFVFFGGGGVWGWGLGLSWAYPQCSILNEDPSLLVSQCSSGAYTQGNRVCVSDLRVFSMAVEDDERDHFVSYFEFLCACRSYR